MKVGHLALGIIILLLISLILTYGFINVNPHSIETDTLGVFIGVDVAFDNIEEIKTQVDATSSYTNLLIVGSTGITFNETKLNDVCQYIFDKGLSFIVFTNDHDSPTLPSGQWIESAKNRWGDLFLGLYVYDEVGGKHLDQYPLRLSDKADNYTNARNQFVAHKKTYCKWRHQTLPRPRGYRLSVQTMRFIGSTTKRDMMWCLRSLSGTTADN